MPEFGSHSLALLAPVHPDLRKVCDEAIKHIDFSITTGCRGAAAQNAAEKAGNSKAMFGHSAHNFSPALAIDFLPYPFNGNWNDLEPFKAIAAVFEKASATVGVPIVWGGCGTNGWEHMHDYPHIQLANWRDLVASGAATLAA